MNVIPSLFASCRGVLRHVVVFGFLALPSAFSADITGAYADKGSAIGSSGAEISLHALLSLEFDQEVSAIAHRETTKVEFIDFGRELETRIHSADGVRNWRGEVWRDRGTFSGSSDQVVMRLRRDMNEDVYLLLLEPIADGQLLQVTVRRIGGTLLGPGVSTVGTYVFHREL